MALQRLLILIGGIGIGIGSFLPWRWFPFGLSVRAFQEFGWITAAFGLAVSLIALMIDPLDRPVSRKPFVIAARIACILSIILVSFVILDSLTAEHRLGPDVGAGIVIGAAILAITASFMQSHTVSTPALSPVQVPHQDSDRPVAPRTRSRNPESPGDTPQTTFILNRETIHLVPETWTALCPSCKTSLVLYRSHLRTNVNCGHCGRIFEVTWP